MTTTTKIEWTDLTWGPVLGCAKVSPGCDRCFAIRTSHRCAHLPGTSALYAGLTARPDGGGPVDWTGTVRTVPERLHDPLRWRKPRRVFVNSQSDLFHDAVPSPFIAQVFTVMAATPQHTYQILTKRPGRMRAVLSNPGFRDDVANGVRSLADGLARLGPLTRIHGSFGPLPRWPLPNVHLGVSVEDQRWADVRVPVLLATPAAVRWVSAEPLLGPVDLSPWLADRSIGWVVTGGESGPGARPAPADWFRAVRDQCATAGMPYHHKQHGEWTSTVTPTDTWYAREPDAWVNRADGTAVQDGDPALASGSWAGMWRVGKKAAGRTLDGVVHDEHPAVSTA